MKFNTPVNNIRMERNMSQILYIGPIVGKKETGSFGLFSQTFISTF